MSNTDLVKPGTTDLATLQTLPTQVERFNAYRHALEAVDDPRCPKPIPRFMVDLPWVTEDDDAAERIIAKMLSSEDPYAVTNAGETLAGADLVGKRVTVWDIRCAPSKFKGGWGAFLLCDVTIGDGELHDVMTIGAKQAVSILALAHFRGDMPVTGTPTVVTETANANQVLGFVVESRL